MDRETFATVYTQLREAETAILAPVRAAEEAIRPQLDLVQGAMDRLCEAMGGEPEAWCESCGMPFFFGDDYSTSEDGVSTCRHDDDDSAPCYAPSGSRMAELKVDPTTTAPADEDDGWPGPQ